MRQIDADAAIDAVEFGITYAKAIDTKTGEVRELFKQSNEELRKAVERIKQLPSVQPERLKGRWIESHEHAYIDNGVKEWINWYCSECDAPNSDPTDFCPNCGADMRGETNG